MREVPEMIYNWFFCFVADKPGREDNARTIISLNLFLLAFPWPLWMSYSIKSNNYFVFLLLADFLLFFFVTRSVKKIFGAYPKNNNAACFTGKRRVLQAIPAFLINIFCLIFCIFFLYKGFLMR